MPTIELEEHFEGPPNIRSIDRQRMARRNSFSLDSETAQYQCLGGCLDIFDERPPITHVAADEVVVIQDVSIWNYDNMEHVDAINLPNRTNVLSATQSWRAQRINAYIRMLNP
jgi:hypothetical protein